MYKAVVLAVSAIAGLAYAQSIPTCATSCITLPEQCNGNPSCICTDAEWIASVSCCVKTNCNEADQQAALSYANTVCTPVGASLPTTASCANGTSSSSSASGPASSSASSATGGVASSASSATSSASSAASSASSAASSAAATASSAALGNPVAVPAAGGLLGAIVGAVALL